MNKLTSQWQIVGDAQRTMMRATWPRAIKVLQTGVDLALLREMAAHGLELIVGRYVFPESGDLGEMDARLTTLLAWAEQLRTVGVRVALEVPYNEEAQNGAALDALAQATIRATGRLLGAGFDAVIGVFSEGNPADLGDWARFAPALRVGRAAWRATTGRVFLGLHEYSVPSVGGPFDGWHEGRYRRVWELLPEECRIPILITEGGIDGGIEGRRATGWRGYFDARRYADWQRRRRREFARDPQVWWVFDFLNGSYPEWSSFSIEDEMDLRPVYSEDEPGPPLWVPEFQPSVSTVEPAKPQEVQTLIRGIDVSNNQGTIDWAQVAASGIAFAAIKASGDEGGGANRFVDAFFATNWQRCGELELGRIAYHYARPSVASPAQSVTLFQECLAAAGGLRPGDCIALDLEDPAVPVGTVLTVWTAEWLDLAERAIGVRPILYTGEYYLREHGMLGVAGLGTYPLWLASYQATMPPPPAGWERIAIWQNSATGVVPGVRGAVDLDVFAGTVAELRSLGLAAPAPAPEPTPAPTSPPSVAGAAVDPVTDALNNLFDLTLQTEAQSEERRRSAQAAIDVLKARLAPN